jgi:hypothetical protein
MRCAGLAIATIVASLSLAGCGIIQRQQQQSQDADIRERRAAGMEDCKAKFQTSPTSKNHADRARCIVDMENSLPSLSGAMPDLVQLRQANTILLAARVDQGKLTAEEANVQMAEINSALVTEGVRRQNASRMAGAQEQAAEAQRQAAFAQTMSALAASQPRPQPTSAPVNCTTTGPYAVRSTSCF